MYMDASSGLCSFIGSYNAFKKVLYNAQKLVLQQKMDILNFIIICHKKSIIVINIFNVKISQNSLLKLLNDK